MVLPAMKQLMNIRKLSEFRMKSTILLLSFNYYPNRKLNLFIFIPTSVIIVFISSRNIGDVYQG